MTDGIPEKQNCPRLGLRGSEMGIPVGDCCKDQECSCHHAKAATPSSRPVAGCTGHTRNPGLTTQEPNLGAGGAPLRRLSHLLARGAIVFGVPRSLQQSRLSEAGRCAQSTIGLATPDGPQTSAWPNGAGGQPEDHHAEGPQREGTRSDRRVLDRRYRLADRRQALRLSQVRAGGDRGGGMFGSSSKAGSN